MYLKIENMEIAFNTPKGKFVAVRDINLEVKQGEIISIIGHSGCGKSTFLRCLNRMNDMIDGTRVEGTILHFDGDVWTPQATGTRRALESVSGRGPGSVWVTGTDGVLLHRTQSYRD